jgi:hypothetical protein
MLSGTFSVAESVKEGKKAPHQFKKSYPRRPRFAYMTLVHGVDETLRYRGYLINALIVKKALTDLGSKHPLIVLLGFTSDETRVLLQNETNADVPATAEVKDAIRIFQGDLQLLKSRDITVHILDRLWSGTKDVKFAEMALLKTSPWRFVEFDRIQFMDGDVMPMQNMDCYFNLAANTFNTGNASPLNSGWFVALPNKEQHADMVTMAQKRLSLPWNETVGWGRIMPNNVLFRGWKRPRQVEKWNFNGASLDQGLFTDYFLLRQGGAILADEEVGRVYGSNFTWTVHSQKEIFAACRGLEPMRAFAHFTGHKKPWLSTHLATTKSPSLRRWAGHLDSLGLPNISTGNIFSMQLKPPLGYWGANK